MDAFGAMDARKHARTVIAENGVRSAINLRMIASVETAPNVRTQFQKESPPIAKYVTQLFVVDIPAIVVGNASQAPITATVAANANRLVTIAIVAVSVIEPPKIVSVAESVIPMNMSSILLNQKAR
jgi:hypothetical protein